MTVAERLAAAGYLPHGDGAWYRPEAASTLARVDIVLFDVDGVVMDTHDSYPHVVADAVQWYFERHLAWPGRSAAEPGARLLHAEETRLFKLAGGFNSDWLCARAGVFLYLCKAVRLTGGRSRPTAPLPPVSLAALRNTPPGIEEFWAEVRWKGGGWEGLREACRELFELDDAGLRAAEAAFDGERVDRMSCELYAGEKCGRIFGFEAREHRSPGYIERERPLLRAEDLRPLLRARPRIRIGLYTGRTDEEAGEALAASGLGRLVDRRLLVTGSRFRKPDPRGLVAAIEGTAGGTGHELSRPAPPAPPRAGILCGDNLDDWQIVAGYRRLEKSRDVPFLFAGILGGAPGPRALDYFIEQGADVIAPRAAGVASLLLAPAPAR